MQRPLTLAALICSAAVFVPLLGHGAPLPALGPVKPVIMKVDATKATRTTALVAGQKVVLAATGAWSIDKRNLYGTFDANGTTTGKPTEACALVPSAKKMAGMGAPIDVPLGHKDAAYVRSHFDAMEVRVTDAPRADEILVAVVVTDSGRPAPRIGGLTKDQVEGKDGLR